MREIQTVSPFHSRFALLAALLAVTLIPFGIRAVGADPNGSTPVDPGETARKGPSLRGAMISPPHFEPEDIEVFAGKWNGNLVRWQFNFGFPHGQGDRATVEEYSAWLDAECARFDRMVPYCRQYGVNVCLDLHTAPGGCDEETVMRAFYVREFQDAFVETWAKLAARYKDEPVVWAYDLMNEPIQPRKASGADSVTWHDLATRAARRIREIDPATPIIVEPSEWGSAASFAGFEPIDVPNVIYSFHNYEPMVMTHQGVNGRPLGPVYPGEIDGVRWDKEKIRESLQPVVEFQKRWNVPIFVGEFGAIRWAPEESAYRFMKDSIEIYEEYGWNWTYHAFREWTGWSVEHSTDRLDLRPASEPTKREKLIRDYFAKNRREPIQAEREGEHDDR